MKSRMKIVERVQDWCSYDQLDGTKLVDGEILNVRFKDGTTEVCEILIEEWEEDISDHGHENSYVQSQAYAVKKFRGTKIKIALAGLRAERQP